MKLYTPRVGTPAPYASHSLFIGDSVRDALKSAFGDYIALSQDFFISGAVVSNAPSGSGLLYSITAGHLMYKGELMEVDAHNVFKSASNVIYIDVQDDPMDTSPVLNTDGNTDYVMRRRHARMRAASVYPTSYMAIDAPRKTTLDRLRNKGRLIPMNGIIPYFGALTDFDATGLGVTDSQMDGFAICNGFNGTPDMRGLVAIGATNVPDTGAPTPYAGIVGSTDPGDTTGADEVTLNADHLPEHTHDYIDMVVAGTGTDVASGSAYPRVDTPKTTEVNTTANNPVSVKQSSFGVVWIMSIL